MQILTRHLCYNCFQERETPEGPCPYCGFDLEDNARKFPTALPAGTVLNNRYIVGRVLGQGGFGITYLALDTQLNARVAIKEFMPSELATRMGTTVSVVADTKSQEFAYGAERFQEEARTLAKFIGHPNIAGVSSYFNENDTSYFVMDYIEGISFKSYIANQGGKVSVDEALNVMIPVLRALTAVHAEGFIHRDVTPDNIYISKDGNVKLLDFGSARYSIGDKSKSLDVVLKVGYAPKEQYIRRGRQGPYTDVYSCAACFYAALTGYLPPESLERMDHDDLVPVSQAGIDIPEWLDRAILRGLAVQPEDRFQTAAEFLDAIENQLVVDLPPQPGQAAPAPVKQKPKPAMIAGIAAVVLALVIGVGVLGGSGGSSGGSSESGSSTTPLIKAEVPSIIIAGEEYSTDLTKLDLREKGLIDEDIKDLKYMVNLTTLRLAGNNLTDISPIENLTQLEYIDLRENPELTDLSCLSGMVNLTEFDFYGSPVENLSFMAGMTKLETIEISGVKPEDAEWLSGMTQAKKLYFNSNDNYLTDLSFLQGMTNLQELNIQGNFDSMDLTPLSGLTGLTRLTIYSSDSNTAGATDLTPLTGLTKLTELSLYADVDSLAPLAGMTQLQTLQLWTGNRVEEYRLTDISALTGMTKLVKLQLSMGEVKDLSPLTGLTKLQELNLYGKGVSAAGSIGFMRGLTNLRSLRISNSGAESSISLEPLSGLTGLQELNISCRVSGNDLSPLRNLTNLRSLDLYLGNYQDPVRDISALGGLSKLNNVSIYYAANNIDRSPVAHVSSVDIRTPN